MVEKRIKSFQALYESVYKEKVEDKVALERAERLIRLVKVVYKL